jgi:hypothetical protein
VASSEITFFKGGPCLAVMDLHIFLQVQESENKGNFGLKV